MQYQNGYPDIFFPPCPDSGLLQLYPILFTLDLDLRIRASGEKPFMKEDSPYLQIYWESPDFWRLKALTGHGGI